VPRNLDIKFKGWSGEENNRKKVSRPSIPPHSNCQNRSKRKLVHHLFSSVLDQEGGFTCPHGKLYYNNIHWLNFIDPYLQLNRC
jgi:hypothetical protein